LTLLVSFLFVNDFKHDFTADEGMDFVLSIATDGYTIDEAAKIIRQHIVPLI